MKPVRILVACGSGIATSTVIANRVKNLCEENGYQPTINQCKITEVASAAGDYDLVVSSTRVAAKVDTPTVFAINYLTGVNAEATDKKILEILDGLDLQG